VADDVGGPPANGRKAEAPLPAVETRHCEACDADFRPARPWSRFCGPARRLSAPIAALFTLGKILIEFYPPCVPSRACARAIPDGKCAVGAKGCVLMIRADVIHSLPLPPVCAPERDGLRSSIEQQKAPRIRSTAIFGGAELAGEWGLRLAAQARPIRDIG
jgi:hypothetical protein